MVRKFKDVPVLGALAVLVPLTMSASVHAQSNVTLFGLIDTGIDFASNVVNASNGVIVPGSGGHVFQAVSGVPIGSHWGLLGSEDLGGGLKTIFRLESGFNAVNGSLGAANTIFSRNAFVGLSSDRYGALTFGKQWDAIVDVVEPFTLNGNFGGWYFSHPNDVDNTDNGFSINNDIKYASPSFNGFKFEGHYSFGGEAGKFSNNAAYGGGASYSIGNFSTGVAYLRVNDPEVSVVGYQSGGGYVNEVYGNALAEARSETILAFGASYQFGRFKLLGDFTNTRFQNGDAGHDVTFQNYELSAIYSLTAALTLAGGYTYTTGSDHATDKSPKYQQLNLIAQYALSKRTDVYVMTALQRAGGDAQFAQIAGFNPSSTSKQAVARIGLTHRF
jgi:predicted porin